MNKIKFCVDCKYYSVERGWEYCNAPANIIHEKNYVNGTTFTNPNWSPGSQREDDWLFSIFISSCGRRARWFKPKPEITNQDNITGNLSTVEKLEYSPFPPLPEPSKKPIFRGKET